MIRAFVLRLLGVHGFALEALERSDDRLTRDHRALADDASDMRVELHQLREDVRVLRSRLDAVTAIPWVQSGLVDVAVANELSKDKPEVAA